MSRIILNTETETEDKFDFSMKVVARQVIRQAMKQENCPFDVEVSLVLTDGPGIRELNRQFRNLDQETDVLSFPGLNFSAPSDFSAANEDPAGAFDPENGALLLGDIVINTARVRSQAKEYGHSEKREFAFLVAHSCMHLCGYDHMVPDEAQVMEDCQNRILNALGITREESGKDEKNSRS